MNHTHHLTVIENVLDTTIRSEKDAIKIFSKLSLAQINDLEECLVEFDNKWVPQQEFSADTMHVGRLFDTLSRPHSWIPKFSTSSSTLDTEKLTRLLIYTPSITAWMPNFWHPGAPFRSEHNKTESYVCRLAGKLSTLRPFLDDGSLTFVPDQFYSRMCEWKHPEDDNAQLKKAVAKSKDISSAIKALVASSTTQNEALAFLHEQFGKNLDWIEDLEYDEHIPSEMLLLARKEASNTEFRNILDTVPFFEGAEEHCSDSRYIWGLGEAEAIKYINPLNEANEDQLVQAILGSSSLCSDETMFKLLQRKHENEALNTNEMIWASKALLLPGINRISIEDLVSVRQNEEAFELWRSTLRKAIRSLSTVSKNQDLQKEAELIFRDEVVPVSRMISQKIKTKSLQAALKTGAVSFGSTTIAAYAFNPSPLVSIATGGATSTLKIIYDLFDRRGIKTERALHRMLSVFKDV